MFIRVIAFIMVIQGVLMANEFVIVANAPSFSEKQVREVSSGKVVIVLDGAANEMKRCGLVPNVILGDFDSVQDMEYWGIRSTFDTIDNNSQPYEGHFKVQIVPAKDQDRTDLEKAILYADAKGATSILILNATGGRMDHTLGNIGVMRKMYRKGRPIRIRTENEMIEYVKDSTTEIRGKVGDHCAIMAYPEAKMTTTGLEYNGDRFSLKLGVQESSCNRLSEPCATVKIEGEALVISPAY